MHRVGRKRKLNGYVMRPLWIQWALLIPGSSAAPNHQVYVQGYLLTALWLCEH